MQDLHEIEINVVLLFPFSPICGPHKCWIRGNDARTRAEAQRLDARPSLSFLATPESTCPEPAAPRPSNLILSVSIQD